MYRHAGLPKRNLPITFVALIKERICSGIFDRSNNMLVRILQLDIDYRVNRALVNLLIRAGVSSAFKGEAVIDRKLHKSNGQSLEA